MEGGGSRVAGRVASRSLVFVNWEDPLGRDTVFRRLAGSEPVHLPRWTGIVSLIGGLAFEYLYCLSTRENGRPRYVRTDSVDLCTVGSSPLDGTLGCTNGTAIASVTVDGPLMGVKASGWYLDTLGRPGREREACTG